MKATRTRSRSARSAIKLEGQLLIAMPAMSDRRFQRSVIYMCAHSAEGAMGLIINQRAEHISAPDLLERLGISARNRDDEITSEALELSIQVGGPVETGRGFVLHSADYFSEDSTLTIEKDVCLTATIDILKAIAQGNGPARALLALGYAGWSPGQLETEIQSNGWLHCPADPDLIFDEDLDNKYSRALAKIGIDLSHLVSDAGHA
ncbi:YqgE/AlgH family protein [Hyphomicrobium methylovorum]|uniref:YqgE/AlgH family protein n=1 Tax=Hyphomicrobium methylovorum TaxID=84 RepID=UPI0015E750FA|nr:YqgE/AlgH family protein [Hyphomicrobium methylovorum]MBA2125827.1 YqgE/AlgH family protein [Hyphomicrobium methylovorum]